MAELKTKPTKESATKHIKSLENKERIKDGLDFLSLFIKATGKKPVMWGKYIVGFGMYHYKSERSAQEGDWPLVAFAPRKGHFTLYLTGVKNEKKLLKQLGKYKMSGGCIHVKKYSDINEIALTKLIKKSAGFMKKLYKVS